MCWIHPSISTIYPGIYPKSPYLLVVTKDNKIKVGYLKIETIETEVTGKIEVPVYRFEDGQRVTGEEMDFWFAIPEIPKKYILPDQPKRLREKTPSGDAIV